MAKAKTDQKAGTDKIYTIPLRRDVIKSPRVKRANRAVSVIREYLSKNFHTDNVKISQMINDVLWERGIHHPPGKIKVRVFVEKDGSVMARLPEEAEKLKEEKKKEVKKAIEKEVEKAREKGLEVAVKEGKEEAAPKEEIKEPKQEIKKEEK